jgi:hypothetical protein
MTPDIFGRTSETISKQYDLFDASSKTLRDISVSDYERSSKTWKALVTKRRGEYSARLKSERLTRENESTFLPTPSATQYGSNQGGAAGRTGKVRHSLESMAKHDLWPTPRANDAEKRGNFDITNPKNGLPAAARLWPTPTAAQGGGERSGDRKGTGNLNYMVRKNLFPTPTVQDSNKATKKMRDNHQNNLTAVVFDQEHFPTPTARDWKGGYTEASLTRKDGKSRRFDALPNAAIGGVGTDIKAGHLNPNWVEWLMGVPTGWTDLGSWGTE